MTKRLIHVKREHINNGDPRSCTTCPIALAVAEKVGSDDLTVSSSEVVLYRHLRLRHRARLSDRAQSFIASYDNGEPVQPFKFYLDVPE